MAENISNINAPEVITSALDVRHSNIDYKQITEAAEQLGNYRQSVFYWRHGLDLTWLQKAPVLAIPYLLFEVVCSLICGTDGFYMTGSFVEIASLHIVFAALGSLIPFFMASATDLDRNAYVFFRRRKYIKDVEALLDSLNKSKDDLRRIEFFSRVENTIRKVQNRQIEGDDVLIHCTITESEAKVNIKCKGSESNFTSQENVVIQRKSEDFEKEYIMSETDASRIFHDGCIDFSWLDGEVDRCASSIQAAIAAHTPKALIESVKPTLFLEQKLAV